MTQRDIERAIRRASAILRQRGYTSGATAADLQAWFEAPTVFPDTIGLDEVLRDNLLLIRELVEITEAKRLGVGITEDVFFRHHAEIERCHRRAMKVELALARESGDFEHLGWRQGRRPPPKRMGLVKGPDPRAEADRLGYRVVYVRHRLLKDHNACYNVVCAGRHVRPSAARKLRIPLGEIWISERRRKYEGFVLFHELQEIKYRAIGLDGRTAHGRAERDELSLWKDDPLWLRMNAEVGIGREHLPRA